MPGGKETGYCDGETDVRQDLKGGYSYAISFSKNTAAALELEINSWRHKLFYLLNIYPRSCWSTLVFLGRGGRVNHNLCDSGVVDPHPGFLERSCDPGLANQNNLSPWTQGLI